jgi:hypothetical protein
LLVQHKDQHHCAIRNLQSGGGGQLLKKRRELLCSFLVWPAIFIPFEGHPWNQ